MKQRSAVVARTLIKTAEARSKERYMLRLYVAGITPKSDRAIRAVKEICDQHLKDRYDLEIVDIYQKPGALRQDQIIAAPTLIKKLPLPVRRMIGDMTDKEKVIVGLDLKLA